MRWLALFMVLLMIGMTVGGQTSNNRIPGFQVEDEIWPDSGVAGGQFGAAIATDGERIAIGAPGEPAVYLYVRQSDEWILEQRIQGTDSSFGAAVAIDGDLLIVGAPEASESVLSPSSGRVELYRHQGTWRHDMSWTCPAVRADGRCGEAVAIDAQQIYIGQPGSLFVQDLQPGLVHMLSRSMDLLRSHGEPEADGLRFGAAIDVDDGHILVGGPARIGTDEVLPGGAFFFDRHGTNWIQRESYRANPDLNTAETFGQNVAIDGVDAIVTTVTTYDVDTGFYFGGAAFFYEQDGESWPHIFTENTELQAVALHNGTAIIGAWFWDALFVYHKFDQDWWIVGWLGGFSFNGRDDTYGFALDYEGRMLAVGAPTAQENGIDTGAAYAYYDNWPPWAYAGQDRRIDDLDENGFEHVTIDGSASWDYDGTIESYRWTLDDELVGQEPVLEITLPLGNHTVILEVTDDVGARDRDAVGIWVRKAVTEASFDWDPHHPWPGQTVRFIDYSSDLRSPIKEWAWDLDGDGRQDNWQREPWTRFSRGGSHDVTLTTTNQDGQTLRATRSIQVQADWPVAFGGWSRYVPLDENGLTATTILDGSGSSADGEIISYAWSSGGRSLGEEEQVEATFTRGTHTVFLEVRDERGAWDTHAFTILALPGDANETALARPDPSIGVEHQWQRNYLFESVGDQGPIQLWDLDNDGTTDAEGRWADVKFDRPGEHQVRLTIYNDEGAKEERVEPVHVRNDAPHAWFWPDHAVIPEGAYLVFYGPSRDEAPLAAWDWRFGDGVTSDHTDVGRTFDRIGNITVELAVEDDGGLEASHEGTIQVLSLADWEAQFGTFEQDVLLNATEQEAPAALGGTVERVQPTFSATETRDPSPAAARDEEREDTPPEILGIPVWIPALLLLLLLAVVLIVAPMRRR